MGYFTQRPVRTDELPALMRKHIFTGAMGTIWGNILTGIVYIYFGNAIGLNRFQWGVLGAIGSWVIVAQPLGAILSDRLGCRKRAWFWFALFDRVLRFLGIIASYLLWLTGHGHAYLLFVVAICVGTLLGNIAVPPWYSWLATIIPQNVQGSFWGRRDATISFAVILVIIPAGILMDSMPEAQKLFVSVLILSAAGIIGFGDIIIHGTIPEPKLPKSGSAGSVANVFKPLRDKRFRPWLAFGVAWNFSQSLGGALCNLYFMENLRFKDDFLGGMIAVTATALAAGVLTARRGGRLVDRWGYRRVLLLSYLLWGTLPFIWLLATPRTGVLWVGFANVIFGAASLAANNAGIKYVTRFPGPADRAMYMAVSSSVANVAAGLGALAAGSFLRLMGGWSLTVGTLVVTSFPLLFMISGAARIAAVVVLVPRIPEKGAPPMDRRRLLLPMFFKLPPIEAQAKQGKRKPSPSLSGVGLAVRRGGDHTAHQTRNGKNRGQVREHGQERRRDGDGED